MVYYPPFQQKILLTSTLAPDILLQKLQDAIEPTRTLRPPYSTDHKIYQGYIVENQFKMRRINNWNLGGRHRAPNFILEGTVIGQVVEVTIRPRLYHLLLCMLLTLLGIPGFLFAPKENQIILFCFGVFFYGGFTWYANSNITKEIDELKSILQITS